MSTPPNNSPNSTDDNVVDSSNPKNSGNLLLAASGSGSMPALQFPTLNVHLDRTNYTLWKHTIKSALEAFRLESFLIADDAPPAQLPVASGSTDPPSPNPAFIEWRKKDMLILLWVRTTLTTSLLAHVARAQSTLEAWGILERMFFAQTRARQMHLKQQMQNLKKGSLSILDYVEKKRSFSNALAECSYLVSDSDFVECILNGLDTSYAGFLTAYSMQKTPLSSDDLLDLLLQEEERISASLTPSCSLPCVFLGYSSRHKGYLCLHVPTHRVYIAHHVIQEIQCKNNRRKMMARRVGNTNPIVGNVTFSDKSTGKRSVYPEDSSDDFNLKNNQCELKLDRKQQLPM